MACTTKQREIPLHYAAESGNFEAAKTLLECMNEGQVQLAVNYQSVIGWSPLLTAASRGHFKVRYDPCLRSRIKVVLPPFQGKKGQSKESGHQMSYKDYFIEEITIPGSALVNILNVNKFTYSEISK